MKVHFLLAAVLICGGCATRQPSAEAAGGASVMRTGDANLTCVQIADEAAALSQRMGGTPNGGVLGAAGGVAKAGAAMLIPGAGLVIAGADALTAPERERRAAEAEALENRWHYLNGLYTARRCLQGG
ncbi:hypothetical protein N0B44_30625 [Roseibacterium beibuensis]|uniref:hypothetical protein n=1 Tax=[Roseibacterium] beibuensis TaxID=1193142 RepID=UPI00217DB3B7|nr:hypothetical protein [Roseibacterium beibuensis]MCS6627270.1 hypothetical protein [Roseibacterium beibuensis]